jgi:hypothetical protein
MTVPLVRPCLRGTSQCAISPEVLALCLQVLIPTDQVPFPGHASNRFRDPVYFRFTSCIPGLLQQFSHPFLIL